ncbi:MAG: diacylglycerol kinase family protein [Eubacteriaceae bacterium]|nr:diacylglycerol kinase family protein [Eubacteriaceae bacterium]
MKRLCSSFKCAICGIINTFGSERNFRIHTFVAFTVVIAGIYFHITPSEWNTVILCIGMVMGMECMNTAVEKTVDIIIPEYDERAKIIKDASAAGVLISAVSAAAAGVGIFLKYIINIFN